MRLVRDRVQHDPVLVLKCQTINNLRRKNSSHVSPATCQAGVIAQPGPHLSCGAPMVLSIAAHPKALRATGAPKAPVFLRSLPPQVKSIATVRLTATPRLASARSDSILGKRRGSGHGCKGLHPHFCHAIVDVTPYASHGRRRQQSRGASINHP